MNMMNHAIAVGLVSSLDDPDGLARVQVTFPYLANTTSAWARLASPMAGPERGVFFRPEVGDEVLVACESGDWRRPYVLGSLWNGVDRPPPDDGDAVANNWRFLRSRSGHILKFDDTEGAERIELIDKDGQRRMVIDSSGNAIEIVADDGAITVTSSQGDVTIEAPSSKVSVAAKEISIEATAEIKIDAPTIKLNGTAIEVTASGTLTLKGATVAIN